MKKKGLKRTFQRGGAIFLAVVLAFQIPAASYASEQTGGWEDSIQSANKLDEGETIPVPAEKPSTEEVNAGGAGTTEGSTTETASTGEETSSGEESSTGEEASTEVGSTEEGSMEEGSMEEGSTGEEVSTEEESSTGEEVTTEEMVTTEEVTLETENMTEMGRNDTVTEDYIIENGVLTWYKVTGPVVTIPEGVRSIGKTAFMENKVVETVIFSNEVSQIDSRAFYNCTNLKEVQLSENLWSIGFEAFRNAPLGDSINQGTLTIPKRVGSIGYGAFQDCVYLGKVIFEAGGSGELQFGNLNDKAGVFQGCSSLKEVVLPGKLKKLSSYTFRNCAALEKVSFAEGLRTIGKGAFQDCTSLLLPKLPESLQEIAAEAFLNAPLGEKPEGGTMVPSSLLIPGRVERIGYRAFKNCDYIGRITFSDTLILESEVNVGGENFADCDRLTNVTLPEGLSTLSDYAFARCSNLLSVEFGKRLSIIGKGAFQDCVSLQEVDLTRNDRVNIKESAYSGCRGLIRVTFPETLLSIGSEAFQGAPLGTVTDPGTIIIPSKVEKIGSRAFSNCEFLGSVRFLENTNNLTFGAFETEAHTFTDCANLKEVILPKGLSEIPSSAFNNNVSLEKLSIPRDVKKIHPLAVRDCAKVTIYGVSGSVAEDYATVAGIPFSKDPEYVTGIVLDKESIELSGGDAIGQQIKLNAMLLPEGNHSSKITWSVTNPAVAKVDEEGLVTILGYGSAKVEAFISKNVKAYCDLEIKGAWSEAEVLEMAAEIKKLNDFTVPMNSYNEVEEIGIRVPNTWEGIHANFEDQMVLLPGVNVYEIVISKSGYKSAVFPVEVNGVEVTGVQIIGPETIQEDTSLNLTAAPVIVGSELPENRYVLDDWKSSNPAVVSVEGGGKITAKKTGKAEISVRLRLFQNGLLIGTTEDLKAGDKDVLWFTAKFSITVVNNGTAMVIESVIKDGVGNIVSPEEMANLVNKESGTKYYVSTSVTSQDGQPAVNPKLTWKSSDTSVAQVKRSGINNAEILIKGKGSAVITVANQDILICKDTIKVVNQDSVPRLEKTALELNLYQTEVSQVMNYYPAYGYQVASDSLSIINQDGSPSDFTIEKLDHARFKITLKGDSGISRSAKRDCVIQLKTSAGENDFLKLPLKINIVLKKPVVKITQTTVSAYDKNSRGILTVQSDTPTEAITYLPSAAGSAMLVQDSGYTGLLPNQMAFQAKDVTQSTLKSVKNKGTLEIKFTGYKPEANYKKTITLAVNKTLPVLTVQPGTIRLFPGTVMEAADLDIFDKAANRDVTCKAGYTVEEAGSSGFVVKTPTLESDSMQVKLGSQSKSKTLTLQVSHNDWFVKVPVKCKVNLGTKPVMLFTQSTIQINRYFTDNDVHIDTTVPYIKDYPQAVFEEIKIRGKSEAAQNMINKGSISFVYENGMLKVSIPKRIIAAIANKTYAYEVESMVSGKTYVYGDLKVNVSAKNVTSKLNGKGMINLLDREGSGMTYTPVLNGYSMAKVKGAILRGKDASKFTVTSQRGQVVVKAKENCVFWNDKKCDLSMELIWENGISTYHNDLKIKPAQIQPKLTLGKSKITLFQSALGTENGQNIALCLDAKSKGVIKWVQPENYKDTFGYDMSTGMVYVKDNGALKAGRTYSLKLAISMEGSSKNKAPLYKTIKITYQK